MSGIYPALGMQTVDDIGRSRNRNSKIQNYNERPGRFIANNVHHLIWQENGSLKDCTHLKDTYKCTIAFQ